MWDILLREHCLIWYVRSSIFSNDNLKDKKKIGLNLLILKVNFTLKVFLIEVDCIAYLCFCYGRIGVCWKHLSKFVYVNCCEFFKECLQFTIVALALIQLWYSLLLFMIGILKKWTESHELKWPIQGDTVKCSCSFFLCIRIDTRYPQSVLRTVYVTKYNE